MKNNISENAQEEEVEMLNAGKNANAAVGGRRRTRRAKKVKGGSSCGAPIMGGKRQTKKGKSRKMSRGASDWNKKVMAVYKELKKKNPATKLGDAMRECSKRKKRGDL